MTQAEKLIKLAAAEVGVRETGNNNVKYNTDFYGKPVSGAAYAWCCAFVWWLFKKAGLSMLFFDGKKTAYCPDVHNWAKKNGLIVDKAKGRPGDIILFDWQPNGKADHIGIIEKVISGGYQTIEGNWENAVKRVARVKMGEVLAVIRPKWGAAAAATPAPVTVVKSPQATAGDFKIGEKVRVKPGNTFYWPGGPKMNPGVPKARWIIVKQTLNNGKPENKGGKRCVVLGAADGFKDINTWCAAEFLERVG